MEFPRLGKLVEYALGAFMPRPVNSRYGDFYGGNTVMLVLIIVLALLAIYATVAAVEFSAASRRELLRIPGLVDKLIERDRHAR